MTQLLSLYMVFCSLVYLFDYINFGDFLDYLFICIFGFIYLCGYLPLPAIFLNSFLVFYLHNYIYIYTYLFVV